MKHKFNPIKRFSLDKIVAESVKGKRRVVLKSKEYHPILKDRFHLYKQNQYTRKK